jgi:hypothetical protein
MNRRRGKLNTREAVWGITVEVVGSFVFIAIGFLLCWLVGR